MNTFAWAWCTFLGGALTGGLAVKADYWLTKRRKQRTQDAMNAEAIRIYREKHGKW